MEQHLWGELRLINIMIFQVNILNMFGFIVIGLLIISDITYISLICLFAFSIVKGLVSETVGLPFVSDCA